MQNWFYHINIKRGITIMVFSILLIPAKAQTTFFQPADSLNKSRVIGVSSGVSLAYAGSMIGLAQLWYKDQPKSSFHFFNDNAHWLQMDKLGHTYSAYWIQNRVNSLFRWSGMNRKSSLIISGAYSFVFQGTFEVLDGFAAEYGFSYGDLVANGAGVTLFTTQEILFKKQIVTPKFSFWPSGYAQYRPQLLGSNFPEQILKDYNAQTYWLSVNLSDIAPKNWKIPSWICLSFGYSISEKLKSDQEFYIIQSGNETKTFEAYRRYLLSLDIDLSRIPVKKPWLKALLSNFNALKIPFPTIEFSSRGTKGYWMYY